MKVKMNLLNQLISNNPRKKQKKTTFFSLFLAIFSCLILLEGCFLSPTERIARILKNHPDLVKSDTMHVTDTIITEGIKKDSSFYFYQKDTIVVQKDNLIMKYFFNRDSTIYLSGEVKRDTIYKDRIVTINSVSVQEHLKWYEKVQRFFIANFFWIIIIVVIFYFAYRMVRKFLI
jgi:hypothetical protein